MKTKSYRYGKFYFKTYFKTVGHGFEIGLTYGRKTLFVSNFVRKEEAQKWWTQINKETTWFVKKYWINSDVSTQWYCHFFSNHLNTVYYTFLDKIFSHRTKTYANAFRKDYRKYQNYKKNWDYSEAPRFKVA